MPTWLSSALTHYGYLAVFIGVFLENVGIPVPGETVLLAAGFFSREKLLHLQIVIPCAIVAAICGDNLGYWIGRRGGRTFAERYGRFIGLTSKRLDAVDDYFHRHGPRTIFFARFISGLRVVAAIFSGISGVPWRTFFAFNAAGAIVWATAVGTLGWAFGRSWPMLERWVGRTGLIAAVVVGAAVVFFLLHNHRLHPAAAVSKRRGRGRHERR